MRTIRIQPNFPSWRTAARELLSARVRPEDLLWDDGTQTAGLFSAEPGELFGSRSEHAADSPQENRPRQVKVPPAFVDLAKLASCHRDPKRWSLLYQIAWRMVVAGERHLLKIAVDADVCAANALAKAVRRDRHKMKAFVRFRKVGQSEDSGREQFVAWFEPEHHIVDLTGPFFAKRFAGMDWSILTPERCVHWDGERLRFTEGVAKSFAPDSDELDDYWRSYYASIFNPARLKLKAMQSEMPVKYWKNLPEAPLIRELTTASAYRTSRMIDRGANEARSHVSAKVPKGVTSAENRAPIESPAAFVSAAGELSLDEMRRAADCCQGCPLHENATRTVFGCGPANAKIMIVGEQPGDKEDLIGQPFVGPAGQLLTTALEAAGIDREQCYLTNTVKHFKWQAGSGAPGVPRGKQRLHRNPNAGEVQACKPWVIAEAMKVRPNVLVCLGATAAKALIRSDFRVLAERGLQEEKVPRAPRVVATVHPSSLLRMGNGAERAAAFDSFVEDLRLASVE